MSGFPAEWLDLREPADHRSRDAGLATQLAAALARADRAVRVLDLGCGTGSNLRALTPHLGERQSWWLLDHEPALLDAARSRLAAWAGNFEEAGGALVLRTGGRRIEVRFRAADLSTGLAGALDMEPDLVTAAALFDLASPDWIDAAAEAVAATGAALLAALTYDGRETWRPTHPLDAAILTAFLKHQQGDKGFGPAAGAAAVAHLARAFERLGYRVRTADSTWHLGPGEGALIGQLVAGIAAAAATTGRVAPADAGTWRRERSREGVVAEIGHVDLLALPPRAALPIPERSA